MKGCHAGGKAKSLRKVVNETNQIGDSITVNDIVIQKSNQQLPPSGIKHKESLFQKQGKVTKSLMNETRDTRDTFGVNSINDNNETNESKILNSGVFNAINTDSTIEPNLASDKKLQKVDESVLAQSIIMQQPRVIKSSHNAQRKYSQNPKGPGSENKTIRTSQGVGNHYYTDHNNSSNTRPQTTQNNSDARLSLASGKLGMKSSFPNMKNSYGSNSKKINLLSQGTKSHPVVENATIDQNRSSNIQT